MGDVSLSTHLAIVIVLGVGGCGADPADLTTTDSADTTHTTDSADTVDSAETVAASQRPTPTLAWEPCDFLSEANANATCALTEVPLSLRDPAARTISLFVKRLAAAPTVVPAGVPRRALWMLMGGPGQAGADGEGLAAALHARDPGLDIYLMDHRGTGRSSRLGCPAQELAFSAGGVGIDKTEWPRCRNAIFNGVGDGLAYYSATEAAYDLESLVRATRQAGDTVFVLGISYGTYLAQRYLQLFPEGAGVDALVLDSICPAVGCHLSEQDLWEDAVSHEILDRCPSDPDCSQYYPADGPSVWDQLGTLYTEVAAGHCPLTGDAELDTYVLRIHLGQLMLSYAGRRLVPAFIRRYRRCDGDDVSAIRQSYVRNLGFDPAALGAADLLPPIAAPLAADDPGANLGFTWGLGANIVISELWSTPGPTLAELEARNSNARACRGASLQVGYAKEGWPAYAEPLADTWPEFRIPILAMNADYDTATPIDLASTIATQLTGPHQTFVKIPGHGHTVIAQGQLLNDPKTTCGRELLLQFLEDPTAPLDPSCVDEVLPLQFKMRPEAVGYWFGTADLWNGGPPVADP